MGAEDAEEWWEQIPCYENLFRELVVPDFFGVLEKLEKTVPRYLEIQRVTKIPDHSTSSRLEKLSSLLSIRTQMDLYQTTLSPTTCWDPVVWTFLICGF